MKMWDIAKRTRIITGQKMVIKDRDKVIAEYNSGTEAQNAQYRDEMQLTVGGIVLTSSQLILYVK